MASRNYYDETIDRIEPDIATIDEGAYYASAAISLRRIANAISFLTFNVVVISLSWMTLYLFGHVK